MPHLIEENEENLKCLKKISGERLIFLEQSMASLHGMNSSILSNSGQELHNVMQQNLKHFKKYKTLNLVLTEDEYFDSELITGFRDFCEANHFDFQVLDGFQEEEVSAGEAYLTMDDVDLVAVIKSVEQQNLTLGKDVGLISLNDNCYKEILAGGISIISSKPCEIGKMAANIIQAGKRQQLQVPMEMIMRKSL
jgi:DNA-binding LacI/PurR family transcriptional regulator